MRVRDAFFTEVYRRIKQGEDIIIVSSDIGAPSLDDLRRDFPHRFVNVGIAEQNAISVATGLQLAGKKVIYYGLNPFPVTRAFDQVRNIMGSLQIPITVTALNAGSCSADAGYTHMAIENMSMMRTLNNVQLINPTDESIAIKLVDELLNNPKPRYVQFDKFLGDTFYDMQEIDFAKGFMCNGVNSEIALISYGIMAKEIMSSNLPTKMIDCFSLPFDEEQLLLELQDVKKIVTLEDGVVAGGLGSMILEILSDYNMSIPVTRRGLRMKDGLPKRYINRNLLFEWEGISPEIIKKEIESLLEVCDL